MRLLSSLLLMNLLIGVGCAAESVAVDPDLLSDEAELRSMRGMVAGDYASGLGSISLERDGRYAGGYADSATSTLVTEAHEVGTFHVRRGKVSSQSNTSLQGVVLILKPASGAAEKRFDLILHQNGDIEVSRAGNAQIWVRQNER